jgi:hypothetical protein
MVLILMILNIIHQSLNYNILAAMSPTTKILFYFYQVQEGNLQLYLGSYLVLDGTISTSTSSCSNSGYLGNKRQLQR